MSQLKIVFVIVAFATFVSCQETYSDRYDDETDVDSILSNETERINYLDCFLGKGPCSPAAEFYTDILPEILCTECKKCTEKQKAMVKTSSEWYITNKPDQWNAIVARGMELVKEKNIKCTE